MRKANLIRTVVIAALLAGFHTPAAVAQHDGHDGSGGIEPGPESAPGIRLGKIKGKVVELSQESITVEWERCDRIETATYMIDGRTLTTGKLAPGVEVVVKYRDADDGVQVATSIEAKRGKRKC